MSSEAWTDNENDLIVADYFAMLADDVAGRPYNKAAHNRELQARIGRSRASLEYKHQNISAVLVGLGETWISGYKPAFNFQVTLVEAVERWLVRNPAWLTRLPDSPHLGAQESAALWISAPPVFATPCSPLEQEQIGSVVRKFDVAGRDERNRALGKAGEARVLEHERAVLKDAGRSDLMREVRWVSQEDGDGAGYDIASFAPDGRLRLIEVKTTNGWARTPFHVTRNELAVAEARREEWCLVRLWDFAREPRAFELRPPLDMHVSLTATSFEATFD
jgi:hypothetical protein